MVTSADIGLDLIPTSQGAEGNKKGISRKKAVKAEAEVGVIF